jgi:hypothetical protein
MEVGAAAGLADGMFEEGEEEAGIRLRVSD